MFIYVYLRCIGYFPEKMERGVEVTVSLFAQLYFCSYLNFYCNFRRVHCFLFSVLITQVTLLNSRQRLMNNFIIQQKFKLIHNIHVAYE